MEWNRKEFGKEKTLFRSYYCVGCKQIKPCDLLTSSDSKWQNYCCLCYFQNKIEESKEYSDYQQIYERKKEEGKEKFQQLLLLKNYSGCSECGNKEVDAYELYENSQLVCQPCLVKKIGGGSSPISFLEQEKWFKRYWRISISEWLENFSYLPVNEKCAREWLRNREHLKDCDCLEREVKELVELFGGSLEEMKERLKECKCKKSEKIRVDSDYSTECEKCDKNIAVASKKRVIKNRNDPRFWGLEVKEKVLCLSCLGKLTEKMPVSKRYRLNKYLKRGY